ncbi:hypothetical protein EV360DRAFT_39717 [Lentinula raphanica]|nr:hypothetical protein EV360DRAFT_39717 [Lentinula raphanica]
MKKEQDDLETKLSNERKAILSKYEAKVQVAKTKASIISTGLSKHEANMLSAALVKELKQFDLERALPAWDGLVLKQEERLAQLGLPDTLFKAEVSERKVSTLTFRVSRISDTRCTGNRKSCRC